LKGLCVCVCVLINTVVLGGKCGAYVCLYGCMCLQCEIFILYESCLCVCVCVCVLFQVYLNDCTYLKVLMATTTGNPYALAFSICPLKWPQPNSRRLIFYRKDVRVEYGLSTGGLSKG